MNQAVYEMESSIIAACMRDNALIDEVGTKIAPVMFETPSYGDLWQLMCDLRLDGTSVTPVEIAVKDAQLASRLGSSVTELFLWPTGNLEGRVERLVGDYIRREVVKELGKLQSKVAETDSVDEIAGDLEQLTGLLHQTSSSDGLHYANVEKYLSEFREKRDHPERAVGFLTGWTKFDGLTGGLKRKKLIVVGARTSIGKSAFAEEIVTRMLRRNVKTGVFSLEMDESDFIDRIISNVTDLFYSKVQHGQAHDADYEKVEEAARRLVRKMAISDERNMRTDAIIAQMKRWKRTKGLDVAIVDYLQEVEEPRQRDDIAGSALTRVVRKLRKAAKDCDCCVIALSQLNRDAEDDSAKPTISNFAGSTGIENVADVTILLHRSRRGESYKMNVNIAKHRNGKTGDVEMYYDRDHQRIVELKQD